MPATPIITIYVRHLAKCKHHSDEFTKRCNCRKWLRWSQNGSRLRVPANTRSWAEAEQVRRELEDQLMGRNIVTATSGVKTIRSAVDVFIADKRVENLSADLIRKYERELGLLISFAESNSVFTLHGLKR